MLGTINPLGERARNSIWGVTVTAYVVGSFVAGLLLGAAAGLLGRFTLSSLAPDSPIPREVLIVALSVGIALDAGLFGLRLPTTHRQVNDVWLRKYRGWAYGLGFGFQLGLGFVTIVVASTVYATFVAGFLARSAALGGAIGGLFGLLRGAAILPGHFVTSPQHLSKLDNTLERSRTGVRRARVCLTAFVIIGLVIVLR